MRLTAGRAILGLVGLALVLRLGFAVAVVGLDAAPRGDEINYQDHAANLAAGKGFVGADGRPTAARPPLVPVVLAGLYRITGPQAAAARCFEILLGTVIVGLTYLLASRLVAPRAGLVAAALVAVNPYLIFISSYLLTENLYTVFLLAVLLALTARPGAGPASLRLVAWAGVLVGLASLARPNAAFLAVFVVPALVAWDGGPAVHRVARASVFVIAIVVTITPWAIRNYARLGAPIFFTTHGGITFYQSNNRLVHDVPNFHGSVAPRESLPGWDRISAAPELEADRLAWSLAITFLRENPGLVPRMLLEKFLRFWRLKSHAASSGVKSGWWWNKNKLLGRLASSFDFGMVYALLTFPCAVVGLVATARDFRRLYLLYAVVALHVLVALAFYGSLRARIPIEPVIALFASAGLARIAGRWRRRGSAPIEAA